MRIRLNFAVIRYSTEGLSMDKRIRNKKKSIIPKEKYAPLFFAL
jgi:hypothetical protein